METKISANDLACAVLKLCLEYPDNKYTFELDAQRKCFYSKGDCSNGSTGCVVGQALLNLGVATSILREMDGQGPVRALLGLRDDVFKGHDGSLKGARARDCDIEWLAKVQERQDKGFTWREAMDYADEYVNTVEEWNGVKPRR